MLCYFFFIIKYAKDIECPFSSEKEKLPKWEKYTTEHVQSLLEVFKSLKIPDTVEKVFYQDLEPTLLFRRNGPVFKVMFTSRLISKLARTGYGAKKCHVMYSIDYSLYTNKIVRNNFNLK